MYNFLVYTVIISIYIIVFNFFKKQIYDKAKNIFEKTLFIMLIIFFIIPTILYIIDCYNIPTKLGFDKYVSFDRWIKFTFDYIGIVSGSIISGLILLIITLFQINKQKEETKEEKRINNLPLIEYDILLNFNNESLNIIDLYQNNRKYNSIVVSIFLKNIGMNSVRKCYIKINSNLIKNDKKRLISKQGIIEKDNIVIVNFRVPIDIDDEFEIIVNYQDILFNWYEQIVNVKINNVHFIKMLQPKADVEIEVNDENIIKTI